MSQLRWQAVLTRHRWVAFTLVVMLTVLGHLLTMLVRL